MTGTKNGFESVSRGDSSAVENGVGDNGNNEMISSALRLAWKSSVAAGLALTFVMVDADTAEAKKRKNAPKKNKAEISYVMSAQDKVKALEILAKPDHLDREEMRALQRALGNAGKIDGYWGKKTAKAVHDFSKKLSAEERAKISGIAAARASAFGFVIEGAAPVVSTAQVTAEPEIQFAPDIPWDKQIADLDKELSAYLMELFGDEAEVGLSNDELAKLKKYFTDMGSMAKRAQTAMGGVPAHEPNVKHQELTLLYDHYVLLAEKAKGGAKNIYSGLPDAVMEFLKGKSLIYKVKPSLMSELVKYGQGNELSESRFDFSRFNLEFKGFDAWARDDVYTTLKTVGEKSHPDDPYTSAVMERFSDEDQAIIRRMFKRYRWDWVHLTAGKLPPAARDSKDQCRILMDPGHGYVLPDGTYDSGAISDGVAEVTPDLERLYYAIALEKAGCEVHTTRFYGHALPIRSKTELSKDAMRVASLKVRPAMAVALGAHVINTDHYNSVDFNPAMKGEIVFYKGASPKTAFVAKEMARELGVRENGTYGSQWHVIKDAPTSMVVLYFERAFITNAEDWEYMFSMSMDFEAARAEGTKRAKLLLQTLEKTPGLDMKYKRPKENNLGNGAILDGREDSPRLDF